MRSALTWTRRSSQACVRAARPGESMYLGSLVNTFLDNCNCETVRVTVEGQVVLHGARGLR